VDKEGKTMDFLLTAKRDKAAAKRFFDKAMEANGTPEKSHDGKERLQQGGD
jgi:transposase-like protein